MNTSKAIPGKLNETQFPKPYPSCLPKQKTRSESQKTDDSLFLGSFQQQTLLPSTDHIHRRWTRKEEYFLKDLMPS